jgi:carbonic anhydrase
MDVLEKHGTAEADIEYLVEALAPAVEAGKRAGGDPWDGAVRAQVALLVEKLKHSPILVTAVEEEKLMIVGAYYNLETGLVEVTVP